MYAPEFRREIEEPVAGAIAVAPDVEVVVTEGNYLLLDDEPWAGVRGLLDEVWYLDLDVERAPGPARRAAPPLRPLRRRGLGAHDGQRRGQRRAGARPSIGPGPTSSSRCG